MCPLWGPHLGVLNSTGYLVLVVERRRSILNSEPSPITPGHPLCVSGLAMRLHVQTYGHILLHRSRKGGLLMKLPWEDQQVTYISILLLSDLWIEIFILEVRCNSLDIAEEKKPEEEKACTVLRELHFAE
ncbi:unnamed protein product [Lepidochelys kempii]